jgi:hypothetical protein
MSDDPKTDENIDVDFLRTYDGGPRIWDAAVLQSKVMALVNEGLIQFVRPDSGLCELTDKGRQMLEANA